MAALIDKNGSFFQSALTPKAGIGGNGNGMVTADLKSTCKVKRPH
jgi:hypothetical protein